MAGQRFKSLNLSNIDLDFIIREATSGFVDKEKLKQLIREDVSFRKALISDDNVFQKVISDEEIFVKISPLLYFEVLLRHTLKALDRVSYTLEKVGGTQVPVFDTQKVVSLLAEEDILDYLADMLASFTRSESFTIPIRVRKGIWRRIRFSDMDIDALSRFCATADDEHKFSFYKRIADVCLFILGIFPEYAHFDYTYPFSHKSVPQIRALGRRGMQEYEEIGRKFYRLAAAHESAKMLGMTAVFEHLYENFNVAWKPLNFLAQHYLHRGKDQLFGVV